MFKTSVQPSFGLSITTVSASIPSVKVTSSRGGVEGSLIASVDRLRSPKYRAGERSPILAGNFKKFEHIRAGFFKFRSLMLRNYTEYPVGILLSCLNIAKPASKSCKNCRHKNNKISKELNKPALLFGFERICCTDVDRVIMQQKKKKLSLKVSLVKTVTNTVTTLCLNYTPSRLQF